MRFVFNLVLSAVVALASVSLAQARHYDGRGMQMVLCTDHGYQTITIDAQGNPVPVTHPCPDCVAAMAAQDLPPMAGLSAPLQTGQKVSFVQFARDAAGRSAPPAFARGPPVM